MKRYHFDNCPIITGHSVDEIVKCPHCFITGSINNMTRWHFDNCISLKELKKNDKLVKDTVRKSEELYLWNKESRDKLSKSKKIPIIQKDLNGNFIREWDSSKDASLGLNISRSLITACCRNRRKQVKGLIFEYK